MFFKSPLILIIFSYFNKNNYWKSSVQKIFKYLFLIKRKVYFLNENIRLGAFDFNGTFFLRKILKILGFFDFFKKNESEAP